MNNNFWTNLKSYVKNFSGTDIEDYNKVLSMIETKKNEIEMLKLMAQSYISKNNVSFSNISFKYINGKRIYADKTYQAYMYQIEILRSEIEQLNELPIMKIHKKYK